jgi:hypothetical protein
LGGVGSGKSFVVAHDLGLLTFPVLLPRPRHKISFYTRSEKSIHLLCRLLTAGPSGVEAVLLLARDDPLDGAEVGRLRGLFANKPPAAQFDPLRGAVWLGREERFGDDRDRARPNYDQSGSVADPVQRLRILVGNELKGLAADVRGVCYPFAGR